jgi:two-component system response regulator HydG
MVKLNEMIDTVSPSADTVVLIEGATGTGKEVVARRIHELSPRASKPFIAVAGHGLTSSLATSELFGHVKGAFTGADTDREGVFERASGGTIFIDDVDDLPMEIQAKLLRVLQERVIERVGEAGKTRAVNFRLVAATKFPLAEMVKDREFREDLYMRLKGVVLKLPPLSQRREDIPLLIQHFIQKYANGRELTLPPGLLDRLMRHAWPGHVRELEQTLKPCIELAKDGVLNEMFIDSAIGDASSAPASSGQPLPAGVDWPMLKDDVKELRVWLAEIERAYIERAVELIGNKTGAAKSLGIARKTLWQKLKEGEGQDESDAADTPGE